MRIKTLLGTTLLASGLFFTQAVVPAMAGVGDPSVAAALAMAPAGTTGRVANGPGGNAGFRVVSFFFNSNGAFQGTQIETNEPNTSSGGGNTGNTGGGNTASVEETYRDTSALFARPFLATPGTPVPLQLIIDSLTGQQAVEQQAAEQRACRDLPGLRAELAAKRKARKEATAKLVAAEKAANKARTAIDDTVISSKEAELRLAKIRVLDAKITAADEAEGAVFAEIFKLEAQIKKCQTSAQSHRLKKGQGFVTGVALTPSADKLSGKFHVARPKAHMPWAVSFDASYSGLDDDRNNADRDADIWSITGSGAVQINRKTVLGSSLTFKDGDVKSEALNSTLDGAYYGFTLFASRQLTDVVNVTAFGGYTRGDNDINLNGATGSFDTDIFNAGMQIQGRYFYPNDVRFTPDATIGFNNSQNDGFLASNGVLSGDRDTTSFNASAGGALSKTFIREKGAVTPSLGLHAIYEKSSGDDLQLINGISLANRLGFGVSVSPAINITMKNGATLGFDASYAYYAKDISSWTLGGRLRIPFN